MGEHVGENVSGEKILADVGALGLVVEGFGEDGEVDDMEKSLVVRLTLEV